MHDTLQKINLTVLETKIFKIKNFLVLSSQLGRKLKKKAKFLFYIVSNPTVAVVHLSQFKLLKIFNFCSSPFEVETTYFDTIDPQLVVKHAWLHLCLI